MTDLAVDTLIRENCEPCNSDYTTDDCQYCIIHRMIKTLQESVIQEAIDKAGGMPYERG